MLSFYTCLLNYAITTEASFFFFFFFNKLQIEYQFPIEQHGSKPFEGCIRDT